MRLLAVLPLLSWNMLWMASSLEAAPRQELALSQEAPAASQAPACNVLTAGVRARIEKIRNLNKTLAAKREKGATSFAGGPGAEYAELQDKVLVERRTTDQLNGMLTGIGCPAIDIEAELAKPTPAQKVDDKGLSAHRK